MPKPKRGLGKGLEALFADNQTADVTVSTLRIADIEPNSAQPRREFSPEALTELAGSIREHGVLQPLVVRPMPSGRYQIVAGERRWRAARIAGLAELPVVVRELSDGEALEIALVENLVRADLNPIEEAMGYRTLMQQFSMTQERVAQRVGKSRPAVANALRLLALPEPVLDRLSKGELTPGHARALLTLPPIRQATAAGQMVAEGMSVRQAESFAKKLLAQLNPAAPSRRAPTPSIYKETELALGAALSRRVQVLHHGDGKGELTVEFYSPEELAALAARLAPG
ncbi:MAG: ParB/RepB/Spo0J family partition protein, partial [Oscillospiraceae bacterium]